MPDPFYLAPEVEDAILREATQRRARFEQARQSITPYMLDRAQQIAEQWPNASPGVVQAAVQYDLDDQQVAGIAGKDDGGPSGIVGTTVGFLSDGIQTAYEYAIKPAVRGVVLASDALSQELIQRPLTAVGAFAQGESPSIRQAYNAYGDSPLVNALQGDLRAPVDPETGEPVEDAGLFGEGLFSIGGRARAESEAERTLTINGRRADIGQALANGAVGSFGGGPGDRAYDAVAGVGGFAVEVGLDPAAWITGGSYTGARLAARMGANQKAVDLIAGGVAGARKAAKQLDAAEARDLLLRLGGAVEGGGRRTVLIEEAERFFGDRDLLNKLAESSAYDIYQGWRRSAANRADTSLIARLGAATDEASVSEVLLDAVQRSEVTERGFYSGLTRFRRTVRDSRLAGTAARGKVTVDDLDDAADKLDSFMRQAKVDRGTREGIFQRLIDLNDPATPWADRADRFYEIVTDTMAATTDNLSGELDAIKNATRLVGSDLKAFREYGIDAAGEPLLVPFIKRRVDPGTGAEVLDPTPMLTSELLQEGFHLPDVTAVRRAAARASRAERLFTNKGWQWGADGARWVTRDLFKPLAILRPAYVVRIGLEEQFRLAAAGYDSILTHPFRFIMANISAKATDTSLTGDKWETVADGLNAINRRAYNVTKDGRRSEATAQVWSQVTKGAEPDATFIEAWRRELGQLSAAREARVLAKDGNLAEFVKWARETAEGKAHVQRIARINPEANDIATNDEALIAWGETIKQRLAAKAGGVVEGGVTRSMGDQDILDMVASGRFAVADSQQTAAASLTNILRGKFDRAPATLKIESSLIDARPERFTDKMNRGVDFLFDFFTGKPTTTWARYPAFRQGYLRYAGRSMDALDSDSTRREFVALLDSAFTLTRKERDALRAAALRHSGKAGFYDDITELDEALKVRAAQDVKDLLFDVTNRSNIQDNYEVFVPFFDAWKEVTTTWARLVKENPAFFIRAQAGMGAMRDSGVIHSNDFGEDVFSYPLSGALSSFFAGDGAEVTLEGRLQGANLVAQGVGPGFGPVVQWGTGAFMPRGSNFTQLREWLAPFGTGGIESAGDLADPSGFIEALTPAWLRKMGNAMTGGGVDPVQWNSMMGDTAKVLAMSGEYDPGDPTDQQRLLADASRGASFLLFMRGLVQGVAITGPSAVWRVRTDGDQEGETIPADWNPEADPSGVLHTIGTLAGEYRRLREHFQYDDELATASFVDMYGIEPWYVAQAKTRSLANLPVDEVGHAWVQEHADVAAAFPSTIGYFVPPNEDEPLDYSIYRQQIEAGDRQSLTAEQQVQLANKAKARQILANVRRKVEGQPAAVREKAIMHTRAVLEGLFPGFSAPVLGVGDSLNTAQRIDELARAVQDPRLADSPVTSTLGTYMQARDLLVRAAQARGVQTLGAQASADLAQRLHTVGVLLSQRDPAFAGVWSQLLSREVEPDAA